MPDEPLRPDPVTTHVKLLIGELVLQIATLKSENEALREQLRQVTKRQT